MAPRNNDENTSYKKKNFPVENDSEIDVKNILPCLLHKKHKVVKLVKSQLQKIQEEGLLCDTQGPDTEIYFVEENTRVRRSDSSGRNSPYVMEASTSKDDEPSRRFREEVDMTATTEGCGKLCLFLYFIMFLITVLLFIFIAVWVSAGPLSNSMTRTPIPTGSFVRTDGLCSLEKKYLLRWSKPEYFE